MFRSEINQLEVLGRVIIPLEDPGVKLEAGARKFNGNNLQMAFIEFQHLLGAPLVDLRERVL